MKIFFRAQTPSKPKILELESEERSKDKTTRLKNAFLFGGAMSCDGLKQKHTGTKVYDLTLHFFQETQVAPSERAHLSFNSRRNLSTLKMISRTLFVSPLDKSANDTALSIRTLLNSMCVHHTNIPFDKFRKHFTLVTYCAATMPNIVGSSISANVAPLDHRWVGCVPHQMNTVLKTVFSRSTLNAAGLADVWSNLEAMRAIVRIFKQGGWNAELPEGKALISEIETRFGLVHTTCSRFIHASTEVYLLIEKKSSSNAREYWKKLESEVGVSHSSISLPTIQAIVDVCEPLVEIMVQMQASKYPTIHLVAPRLLHVKTVLQRISCGIEVINPSSRPRIPNAISMKLAALTLNVLDEKFLFHPIYVGSILLHPLMGTFAWVSDISLRDKYFSAAEKYVKKYFGTYCSP